MFQIKTNTTNTSDIDKPFDIVFFAAPWHLSPVNHKLLEPYFDEEIPCVVPLPHAAALLICADSKLTFAYM